MLRTPFFSRARSRAAGILALAAAVVVTGVGTVVAPTPPAAQAAVAEPVTCSTDGSFANTGRDQAAGLALPAGAADPVWDVKRSWSVPTADFGYQPGDSYESSLVNATGWMTPTVGADPAWVASAFSSAAWIREVNNRRADRRFEHFRLQFTLADDVDPATFQLHLNAAADDVLVNVHVNGDALFATNTYQTSFGAFAELPVLEGSWQTGLNEVVFTVIDEGWAVGLLVESRAAATCVPHDLSVEKTSSATADTRVGDTITYTVTATNTGRRDFTQEHPATVVDDLTGVLDDGAHGGDAVASRPGSLPYAEPELRWSGALPAGESVEITYTAALLPGGDGVVENTACLPGGSGGGGGGGGGGGEGRVGGTGLLAIGDCVSTVTELPRLTIEKVADATELPAVGERATYTVTVTNAGPGAYTVAAPASMTDDLSDVLDDATIVPGSLTSDVGSAVVTDDELTWTGPLAAGESATISYAVSYTGEGDQSLVNRACIPASQALPGTDPCAAVSLPGALLEVTKSVETSTAPVVAGTTLAYTVAFENRGTTPASVDHVDLLAHVLDDAGMTIEPSSPSLSVARDGDRISITGAVEPGETATVSYTVTVRPERGDDVAANFVVANDSENPPVVPTSPSCDPALQVCTTTPISSTTITPTGAPPETPGTGATSPAGTMGPSPAATTPSAGTALPVTGARSAGVLAVAALLLLGGGAAALLVRRRRARA